MSSKTVVIISTMRFVDNFSAGVNRTSNYANMLTDSNIKVIFASLNEYHSDASLHTFNNNPLQQVFYSNTALQKKLFFRKQIFKIKSFLKSISSFDVQENVVFFLYPSKDTLFDMFVLSFLKRKMKHKVFYELNEIRKHSYDTLSFKGLIKYFLNSLNEKFYGGYDGFLCISSNIQKFINPKKDNNILVPILLDAEKTSLFQPKYETGSIFRIAFAGTIGKNKEHPEPFFKALQQLVQKGFTNFEFNLFGFFSKTELSQLNKSIQKYNLSNYVFFRGGFQQNQLLKQLQQQHLLVLPRHQTRQNMYGFSTKLSDYLLSNVPILLTDVSDNVMYFQDGFNGLVANPNCPDSYEEKILYLISNYNTIAPILAQNAFNTAKNSFDYRKQTEKVVRFLFPNINNIQ